jgi:hypothetical protein
MPSRGWISTKKPMGTALIEEAHAVKNRVVDRKR